MCAVAVAVAVDVAVVVVGDGGGDRFVNAHPVTTTETFGACQHVISNHSCTNQFYGKSQAGGESMNMYLYMYILTYTLYACIHMYCLWIHTVNVGVEMCMYTYLLIYFCTSFHMNVLV